MYVHIEVPKYINEYATFGRQQQQKQNMAIIKIVQPKRKMRNRCSAHAPECVCVPQQ